MRDSGGRVSGRGGEGREGRTGRGAGCFDEAISPSMHALHARVICVVGPRDGFSVVGGVEWGDDGGAVG